MGRPKEPERRPLESKALPSDLLTTLDAVYRDTGRVSIIDGNKGVIKKGGSDSPDDIVRRPLMPSDLKIVR